MKKDSPIRKAAVYLLSIYFILISIETTDSAGEQQMFHHRPKHTIFLIHGIAGHKRHFFHTAKALRAVLGAKDPSTKYIIKHIEYETGHDEKTPYEFARDIDTIIKRTTASGRFKPEDKFSLIMHSQGGLVGAIWVFQSLMGAEGFATRDTIKHLDSFITIGTPFWGAKTAKWGSEIKGVIKRMNVDVPLKFGLQELEQMSFGSDMIYDFRMALIDPQYATYIDYLRQNVKFLNIVGVADLLNPLGIFVSGTDKYEDDGAVPLSSARFNFIYNQSLKSDYRQGDRVSLANSRSIDLAPYVVVNAMHRSPLPQMENFAGIAQIPKACAKEDECLHPTFPYLVDTILGKEAYQRDEQLGDFKTFLLDLNVRVQAEEEYHCDDLVVDITKLNGKPLEDSNIEISKFYELYSNGRRRSDRYYNHCRFYYTGSIKKILENRQEAVLIKIAGKNLRTRYVEMRLKETYSSFVEVNVIPL